MGMKISLNANSITRFLSAIAVFLILDSVLALLLDDLTEHRSAFFHKLVKLFYVDLEMNVPAFFSMTMLLIASFLLAIIAFLKKQEKAAFVLQWTTLSLGFLLMAFDEVIAVHERLIEPMRAVLGEENLGVLYFAWVVPAIPLVICLGVLFLRFLWNLPAKTKTCFILAGAIFLGGAIGCELIESAYCEIYGKENLLYMIQTTIEESMEMGGIILFIYALLSYLTESYGEVRLQFREMTSREA
jgi:hypothetical protein